MGGSGCQTGGVNLGIGSDEFFYHTGYDRIAVALKNLGRTVSDQSVGNVLGRHDIPEAPQRKTKTTWAEFIPSHSAVLAATDFFSADDSF